ncbi:MAG: hypothetical protein KAS36_15715, partial [Anaerolineales bacterium]|nr:hypothetical protein [Anaerolineales bacterium]
VGLKKSLETLGKEIVVAAEASNAFKKGLIRFEQEKPKFQREGREFQLKTVDVRKLTAALNKFGENIKRPPADIKPKEIAGLLQKLIALTEQSLKITPNREDMATALAQALQRQTGRRVTAAQVSEKFQGDELTEKYIAYIVPNELKKAMREVVKTIAIPAVKVTEQGTKVIETRAGAQRNVGQFAKFERGFEVLLKRLERAEAKTPDSEQKFVIQELRKAIVGELEKPGKGGTISKATLGSIFNPLLKEYGRLNADALRKGMAEAIATQQAKAVGGLSAGDFEKRVAELSSQTMPQLKKVMTDLHLNAVDVVNTFAELKRLNIYDVISQSLKAQTTGVGGAQQPFDKNFWDRVERGQESAFRRF